MSSGKPNLPRLCEEDKSIRGKLRRIGQDCLRSASCIEGAHSACLLACMCSGMFPARSVFTPPGCTEYDSTPWSTYSAQMNSVKRIRAHFGHLVSAGPFPNALGAATGYVDDGLLAAHDHQRQEQASDLVDAADIDVPRPPPFIWVGARKGDSLLQVAGMMDEHV